MTGRLASIVAASLVVTLSASAQFQLPKIPRIPKIPGVENIPGVDKLLGNESALTTNLADARTEIAFLDDFDAVYPRPLPDVDSSGTVTLPPGAYAYVAQSYCLHAGTYAPRAGARGDSRGGAGYLYAPLRGARAKSISDVLKRSAAHPEIGQGDIQVLLWAIISKAKLSEMSADRQRVAAQLLTPRELFDLNGGAVGLIPDDVKRQALARLSGPLRTIFEAEDNIRRLVTSANASFADIERVAVLVGDPPPDPKDRSDLPENRWSYNPTGYFIRYSAVGFSTTNVQIYVPGNFDIERDDLGRITTVTDERGNRITTLYRATPRSVNSANARAFAFTSIRFEQRSQDPLEWHDSGWLLSGIPDDRSEVAGRTDDMTDVPRRVAIVRQRRADFEHLLVNASTRRRAAEGVPDLVDLASYYDALKSAVHSTPESGARVSLMLNEVLEAWQSMLANSLADRAPQVASLNPFAATANSTPTTLAKNSGPKSVDLSNNVAVPGWVGRQRLGQSARKQCDDGDQCEALGRAIAALKGGIGAPGAKTVLSPKLTGTSAQIAAANALKQNFKKNVQDALQKAADAMCADSAARQKLLDLKSGLGGVNINPTHASDFVNNNRILDGMVRELRLMTDAKCSTKPPNGQCDVDPLKKLEDVDATKCDAQYIASGKCAATEEACWKEGKCPAGWTRTTGVDTDLKNDLDCMINGGKQNDAPDKFSVTIGSGYRSHDYQQHLRDMYDKYMELLRNRNPACDDLRRQVEEEYKKHAVNQHPNNPDLPQHAMHTSGGALDLTPISELSDSDVDFDQVAACCHMYRPYGKDDHEHYEVCPDNCDNVKGADKKARCKATCENSLCTGL